MLVLAPSTVDMLDRFLEGDVERTIGQVIPELLLLVGKLGQGPNGQLPTMALLTVLVTSNTAVQHAIVVTVGSEEDHVTKDSSGVGRNADAVLESLLGLLAELGALSRIEVFGPAKKTHVGSPVVADDEQHALVVLGDSGTLDVVDSWSMIEDKLEGFSVLWELDLGLASLVAGGASDK